jgi:hypothetical protein
MKKCNGRLTNECFLIQSQLNKPGAELSGLSQGVKPCSRQNVLIISTLSLSGTAAGTDLLRAIRLYAEPAGGCTPPSAHRLFLDSRLSSTLVSGNTGHQDARPDSPRHMARTLRCNRTTRHVPVQVPFSDGQAHDTYTTPCAGDISRWFPAHP